MTRSSRYKSGVVAVALLAIPTAVAAAPKEAGVWLDDTGQGAVKIEPCGTNRLCGRIYWLKEPLTAKGQPKVDAYNPDAAQRTRPVCGLPVIGQLEQMPEGGWDAGWVYDPKEGKSYSVAIVLEGPNALSVTGYKGVRFLGKTFRWTRAPSTLPSCAQNAATAPEPVKPKAATKSAVAGDAVPKPAPAARPKGVTAQGEKPVAKSAIKPAATIADR